MPYSWSTHPGRRLHQLPQVSGLDSAYRFTFSTSWRERIAYAIDQRTGLLHRYNTATMQLEDAASSGHPEHGRAEGDDVAPSGQDDGCSWGLWDGTTAFAWNSRTNQLLTHGSRG